MQLGQDGQPRKTAFEQCNHRGGIGAKTSRLDCRDNHRAVQGPSYPVPSGPRTLVRIEMVLRHLALESGTNDIAVVANGVAVSSDEETTVEGGGAYTHLLV